MKQTIKEEIYRKHFAGYLHPVRVADLPADLRADDIIEIVREEAYHGEDHAYDEYTDLVIIREREETDAEYAERLLEAKQLAEELKQRRYATYLKLKKEFEDTPTRSGDEGGAIPQ